MTEKIRLTIISQDILGYYFACDIVCPENNMPPKEQVAFCERFIQEIEEDTKVFTFSPYIAKGLEYYAWKRKEEIHILYVSNIKGETKIDNDLERIFEAFSEPLDKLVFKEI